MALRSSRRGIALISIVLVMLILTLLAITFVATTTAQSRFSMNRQNSTVLRQTALIGINEMQKLLGTEAFKYRWHKADRWTQNGSGPVERFVPENNAYYRIVVKNNECRPDWCTVTSEAYFNKDKNTGEPISPVKRISVTFKKNCFQYAALGTSEGDLGVKIVGSTYTATGISRTSSQSSMAMNLRSLELSYRSGNPSHNPSYNPSSQYPQSITTSHYTQSITTSHYTQSITTSPSPGAGITGSGSSSSGSTESPDSETSVPSTTYTADKSMSVIDGDVGACRKSSVAVSLGDADSSSASSSQSSSSASNTGSSELNFTNTLTVTPAKTENSRCSGGCGWSGSCCGAPLYYFNFNTYTSGCGGYSNSSGGYSNSSGGGASSSAPAVEVVEIDVSRILGNIIIYDGAGVKKGKDIELDEEKIVRVVKGVDEKEQVIASPTVQYPSAEYMEKTITTGDNELESGFYRISSIALSGGTTTITSKGGPLYLLTDSLSLDGAVLSFNTKGDPVYIFVKNSIEIRNSQVNTGNDPRELLVYKLEDSRLPLPDNSQEEWTAFTPDVKITENSTANFLLLAPSSSVQISSSHLLGSFIGNKILISEKSDVTFPKDTLGKLKDVAIIISWEEK